MDDHLKERIIAAVAQNPFEHESEGGGQVNLFCLLKPVLLEDGTRADPREFVNNGLIWWMVLPRLRALAQPGRLFTGTLEEARIYKRDESGSSYYQINRDSAEPAGQDELFEILTVDDDVIGHARALLNVEALVRLDHPPTATVLVRWRERIYGPLRASANPIESAHHQYAVSFANPATDRSVLEIPATDLDAIAPDPERRFTLDLSGDAHPPERTRHPIRCVYEVILPEQFKALASRGERISLASDADVLRALSKRVLTRKKRQQLTQLLAELETAITSGTDGISDEERAALRSTLAVLERDDVLAGELSNAVLESGLIENRIEKGIQARAESYIEERAATLQADVAAKISRGRQELRELETERTKLEETLAARKQRADREIEAAHALQLADLETHQRRIREQEQKLEEQQQVIRQHLEEVTTRFTTARQEVLNQFLELVPLLSQTGIVAPAMQPVHGGHSPSSGEDRTRRPEFLIPAHVRPDVPESDDTHVSEEEFFERLVRHAADAGFSYRRLDLASFHISVKCSDLTILGGVSGTGKSTLPRLYAEALGGTGSGARERYLAIGVSPSWLDMRDLLGHVNALDRVFHPAESGLYQQMIVAAEELRQRGTATGIYITCLDEMNLSHVEHYFSGFLQAFERPDGQRVVPVFAPQNVDTSDPFHRWPSVEIPRSSRFVGTVNFDETTKQLSLRVLDRANLIQLRPGKLPELNLEGASERRTGSVAGPPITLRAYQSWIKREMLDPGLGGIIDALREPLLALGCPLSPRRYRAILQFVASANGLCKPGDALDLQISQRILPQVRGLFRREARDALDELARILDSQTVSFPESLRYAEQLRNDEAASLLITD